MKKYDLAHMHLLSLWLLLLLTKTNEQVFLKQICLITELLSATDNVDNLVDFQKKLARFYLANRPSFWFEFLDALENNLLVFCRKELVLIGVLQNENSPKSEHSILRKRIITSSPFPTDIWKNIDGSRKILRHGGRVIICE